MPKTFNILFVLSMVDRKFVEDDVKKLETFISDRFPFKIKSSFLDAKLVVQHKSFNVSVDNSGELWGLDGARQAIATVIPDKYRYHAVFFVYKLDEKPYTVANWTTFKPIFPWCEWVEIPFKKAWDDKQDLYRVFTHEIFHVFHNRVRRAGIPTTDTMDQYDDEFEPESSKGNRARNTAELLPFAAKIIAQPFLVRLLNLIARMLEARSNTTSTAPKPAQDESSSPEVPEVPEAPKAPSRIEQWAEAIKIYEGWFPGSRSYRQNNPGNLRWSPTEIGNNGFSIFKDYESGWNALIHQLTIAARGYSGVYRPDMTLREFFATYAPSTDGNYPEKYAKFVADKLGVSVDYQIKDFV